LKAVILAAGKGERIKEIARKIPKPMIEFRGKPILQHNIELCKRHGISELYINTHYLPEVITGYFGAGERFGVQIVYSYEPEQLGTAGALRSFRTQLSEAPFFVLYGDNYSDFDLSIMMKMSRRHHDAPVIAFHWRDDTSSSGVGEFDREGRVVKFVEKPSEGETTSHWVNAGIYLLPPSILAEIPAGTSDFAKDIFPHLLRKRWPLFSVRGKFDLRAFDTPEMYHRSQNQSNKDNQ
jgi:NDP-sugar pyrophosphorylase family protein